MNKKEQSITNLPEEKKALSTCKIQAKETNSSTRKNETLLCHNKKVIHFFIEK